VTWVGAVVVWALQPQRVSRSVLDQVAARPEPLMVNLLRSYPHAARRTVTQCERGAPLDPFPTRDPGAPESAFWPPSGSLRRQW